MERLKLISITQQTGSKNIVIKALNIMTMKKETFHAEVEEVPFFSRIFDTGETFIMDDGIVYNDTMQRITKA